MLNLTEINQMVNGQLHGKDITVRSIAIDTRTLTPDSLYIGIKGENFDGNAFVGQAEQAGAIAAIVEKPVSTDLPYIQVENSRQALADIASGWRQRFNLKMVAVTGSNGKTTVKEMIAAILSEQAPVLFTQGNLNNEIGVPLTLLRLTDEHQFAVIEMGANHVGEIAHSCATASPDVSLVNNVGPAHIEGFGSLEGVAKAKGEIYSGLSDQGIAVLNRDDPFYDYWQSVVGQRQQISFGLNEQSSVRADDIESGVFDNRFSNRFVLHIEGGIEEINLALPGTHNVCNALAAASAATAFGVPLSTIKLGLEKVRAVTGRLQLLRSQFGGIIIDDTYNANPASLKAGLQVLSECPGEHWMVLGAFGELGENSHSIHRDLGDLLKEMQVKRLFATGDDALFTVKQFGDGGCFYTNKTALIDDLKTQLSDTQSVLIKGSRSQKMEQVAAALIKDFRV